MKWTKKTWKTFEETTRRGRRRSLKAWLVPSIDGGDLQVVSGTGSVVYYLLFICLSSEEQTFSVRSRRSTKSQPKVCSIYIQFQVTCYEKNSRNWIGRFMLAMDYGVCSSSRDKNINIRFTVSSDAQRTDTGHSFTCICRKGTNKDAILHAP
jgi:hypothetical protein